jgi:hypothetical protein
MDVVFGMRKAGKDYEEVQDDPYICDSITSHKIRVMALRCEMGLGDRVGYEWSEKLYAERSEILYEKQGPMD